MITRTYLRAAFLTLACAGLAACTQPPIPTPDCATADWRATGVGDGAGGRGQERLATHVAACAASPRPVNEDAWHNGYAEGLRAYCTPAHAMDLGRRGKRMNPICPEEMRANIAAASDGGFEEFWQMREIADLQSEMPFAWGFAGGGGFPGPMYEYSMISSRIAGARAKLAWIRERNEEMLAGF